MFLVLRYILDSRSDAAYFYAILEVMQLAKIRRL
nr:MAG TPA: hypothetical protein [Bacteriophage sp.]